MSTAREKIGKQAIEVMQDLQELRNAANDADGENHEPSRESDSEPCEGGRDKLLHVKRSVRQFIRELPIKSVLIAVGAGVLLGTFWTIRRRCSHAHAVMVPRNAGKYRLGNCEAD
jgi:hypothetical protein